MEFHFILVDWDGRILLHTRQLHLLGIFHELVLEMNNGNSRRGLLLGVGVAVIMLVIGLALGSVLFPVTKNSAITYTSTKSVTYSTTLVGSGSSGTRVLATEIVIVQTFVVIPSPECYSWVPTVSSSTLYIYNATKVSATTNVVTLTLNITSTSTSFTHLNINFSQSCA